MERDGIDWMLITQAAILSRVKATSIAKLVGAGSIKSFQERGLTYIPVSVAYRLKREEALMAKVRRMNRGNLQPSNRGLALGEEQDVLPMSSGRGGRGWRGNTPDDPDE